MGNSSSSTTSDTSTPSPPMPSPVSFVIFIVVVMAVTLVLNFLVNKCWCVEEPGQIQAPKLNLIPIFKYKKRQVLDDDDDDAGEGECAVCISEFEEGEELKRLPTCKHSFHAACIDMWLSSHLDCPLCRSPVDPPLLRPLSREAAHIV